MISKLALRLAAAAGIVLLAAPAAAQQPYPNRQMNFLYGSLVGGVVDFLTRQYAEIVGRSLGQTIVFDPKPGAGGIIAAQALTQARPDGHSIMLALGGMHTVAPHLQKVPFDPINDFEPVTLLFSFPVFIGVQASSPAKSIPDLVALAKAKEKGLSYGSPGPGSPMHLMGALFKDSTGANVVHIGYRGGPPMLAALLSGEIDFAWPSYSQVRSNLDKIRPLAVADKERWAGLPNVPTFDELGYKGIDLDSWFGVITTKGTPRPIVERLNAEFIKATRHPDIVKRMAEEGFRPREATPEQFKALMVADYNRLGALIRKHDLKAEN